MQTTWIIENRRFIIIFNRRAITKTCIYLWANEMVSKLAYKEKKQQKTSA